MSSTVALRGTIEYDVTTKEWTWKGLWTFGTSLADVAAAADAAADAADIKITTAATSVTTTTTTTATSSSSSSSRRGQQQQQRPKYQPFVYTWSEAVDPSTVPVPSLNPAIEEDVGQQEEEEVDEDDDHENRNFIENSNNNNNNNNGMDVEVDCKNIELASTVTAATTATTTQSLIPPNKEEITDDSKSKSIVNTEGVDKTSNEESAITIDVINDDNKKENIVAEDGVSSIRELVEPSSLTVQQQQQTAATTTTTMSSSSAPTISAGAVITAIDATGTSHQPEELPAQLQSNKKSLPPPPTVTFASVIPNFTDVSSIWTPPTITTTNTTTTEDTTEGGPKDDDVVTEQAVSVPTVLPYPPPPSGKWVGHFENVTKTTTTTTTTSSTGRTSSSNVSPRPPPAPPQKQHIVEETFYLFLNANPTSVVDTTTTIDDTTIPIDETTTTTTPLFTFEDSPSEYIPPASLLVLHNDSCSRRLANNNIDKVNKDGSDGIDDMEDSPATTTVAAKTTPSLPSSSLSPLVQVRGCGENQFGTFEIFGFLDLTTMIMEIQRQYVVVETRTTSRQGRKNKSHSRRGTATPTSRRKRSTSSLMSGQQIDATSGTASSDGSRPYSTRKRMPSWKRMSYDPDEGARGKNSNKRLKQSPQQQDQQQKQQEQQLQDQSTATSLPSGDDFNTTMPSSTSPLQPKQLNATVGGIDTQQNFNTMSVDTSNTNTTIGDTVAGPSTGESVLMLSGPAVVPPPPPPGGWSVGNTINPVESQTSAASTTSNASSRSRTGPGDVAGSKKVSTVPTTSVSSVQGPTTVTTAHSWMVLPTQKSAATRNSRGGGTSTGGGRGIGKRTLSSSSSGGGGGVRTKQSNTITTTSGIGSTGSTISGGGSSPHIRLPPVGDAKKARWRAAHFLYYHRPDPDQIQQQQQSNDNSKNGVSNSGTNNNNNKLTPSPRYVIYEGEMVDSKREGRGVCLYNNGVLYEGEWKRNKEHGYGKLMTSDRKKIVYEGEWERGRMQGKGTYYYGSSDPKQPGARYIGEFKENLRNGIGRYHLPNGSVYDGQWREGMMSGRGVFTWPDGSVYDGEWKDGKRNGSGLLKTSDGFIYDGFWVHNSMEGRGSATYPNGQTYEGLFSNGRREGRGTMRFTNGAVYEGRFRDDAVDGQGTMKMSRTMVVPADEVEEPVDDDVDGAESAGNDVTNGEMKKVKQKRKHDFMIPISFQSDMTHIHTRAGFTAHGE